MILKYRFFKSSEEFESFQKDNDVKLFNITPMVNSMNMEAISNNQNTGIEASYGVFVTYTEKGNDNE